MKKIVKFIIVVSVLLFVMIFGFSRERVSLFFHSKKMIMQLMSPVFVNEGSIPSLYTCEGENKNPPLEIGGVPSMTKGLALIMEDPDVPRNIRPDGIWDHWAVWNIDPKTTNIPEGKLLSGITGKNTNGNLAYAGPCPPDREHRYFFRIYALDNILDLPAGSTKKDLLNAMFGHIIEQAQLMGKYVKKSL